MNHLKNSISLLFFITIAIAGCNPHKKLTSTKEKAILKEDKATTVAISNSEIKTKYSLLLNVDKNAIDNLPLYALIDEWYGTTYKYGGCDKSGIDCSNFVGMLYQEIFKKTIKGSSASILNQCQLIAKGELQEGDLVFFKIEKNSVSHIGMYLQNHKFVHATTQRGVMIDDLDTPYYAKYFYKAGRVK